MSERNKNLIFILCIFIISMFIITFMMYLSQNSYFWGDDCAYAVYVWDNSYFDCLIGKPFHRHGDYYLGLFLCKFFSFGLPNLLSIHPADFITYGHGCIKGIFTAITLILITKFAVFKSNSKLIYISFLFLLTSYYFQNALYAGLFVSYHFYRYFFSFIFFSIFWYYILTNILLPPPESKNEKYINLNLIGVTICGFILGTSIEISFYASAFLAFLLVFYNTVLSLFSFIFKNKNILIHKYNLGLKFYIPILGLFSGIILFVTNPGSIEVAKDRGMANIHINLDILKEYSQLYFQRCFSEHLIYWGIFIVLLSVSVYYAFKKQEIKDVIFPILMQISILTVMFSLILCGKTSYNNGFWINLHGNILFLYKIIIIFPFLICFDYAITKISSNYKNIILYNAIMLILISCFAFYNIEKYLQSEDNKMFFRMMAICRKENYVTDKIFRFYAERKEKPILPPDVFNNNTNHWFFTYTYPYYTYYPYLCFGIQAQYNTSIKNITVNNYMARIYKDTEEHEYEIKEDALDLFYSKGGTFTEEELKHIKFSRLFDKKFVLNEK